MTNPADIPQPLPWEERYKSATSIRGGYTGQLKTLRKICQFVEMDRPGHSDLVKWIQDNLKMEVKNSEDIVRNLLSRKILESIDSKITLNQHARHWYASEDDGLLIALLHSRIQFFGEMLEELRGAPLTTGELLEVAKKYGLNWASPSQIEQRRGWLESANLVEPIGIDRLAITDAGRELLALLTLHRRERPDRNGGQNPPTTPATTRFGPDETFPPIGAPDIDQRTATSDPSPAQALADEIRDASTDSRNPERLELAIRDAFQFLGFDAEKLGGNGKTDVLVKAPLGKHDSYSVAIDAKTVGSGSLGYGQVDYLVLDSHRKQHKADYSMLVGPNPSGKQLMDLAVAQSVAVLSTEQLADLCLQHAGAPLGLQSYRALFETGGAVETSPIEEEAKNLTRLLDLAAEICGELAEQTKKFGSIGASQLQMVLGHSTDESEIQQVLDTLASPLVGAIQGTADKGYVLASAPRVIQQRLQQLGDRLAR